MADDTNQEWMMREKSIHHLRGRAEVGTDDGGRVFGTDVAV
jgi:hypothetical protein